MHTWSSIEIIREEWKLILGLIGMFALTALAVSTCVPEPAHAMSGGYPVHCEKGHPDTNPPEVHAWFEKLKNRAEHPCCSESDGYPAIIDEDAAPGHLGRGHVIEGSEKEIWVKGCAIKRRPGIPNGSTFTFTWDVMTPEPLGNPLKTAYVFLYPSIDESGTKIGGVHCVVPLPPAF